MTNVIKQIVLEEKARIKEKYSDFRDTQNISLLVNELNTRWFEIMSDLIKAWDAWNKIGTSLDEHQDKVFEILEDSAHPSSTITSYLAIFKNSHYYYIAQALIKVIKILALDATPNRELLLSLEQGILPESNDCMMYGDFNHMISLCTQRDAIFLFKYILAFCKSRLPEQTDIFRHIKLLTMQIKGDLF